MSVQVGDRVGYSAHFLHSISADYEVAQRRGDVTALERDGRFVRVLWDDQRDTQLVAASNVARVGSVRFSDPHAKHR